MTLREGHECEDSLVGQIDVDRHNSTGLLDPGDLVDG